MDGSPFSDPQSSVACSACGQPNAPASLFCTRCTAPLSVAALQDLDDADLSLCRSALFQILADVTGSPASQADASHDRSLWESYLSAFWLRPETALILYAEAMAVRSINDRTLAPWLDLGCGDGVHAALTAGWTFDPYFDAFQSLDLAAKDIYHHWNPDHFDAKIVNRGRTIDHGIDIKPTAVARAGALGVFGRVGCADARALPLADESVGTIFSNMLRDLGDPLPAALRECRRVLKPGGLLLLSAMTPLYASSLHFVPAAREAEAAGNPELARRLLRLDRGRSVFCQRQLSLPQWQALFGECGLQLVEALPIVSPAVIRFWDVGLRPFSPALLRQRQAWGDAGVLSAFKPAAVKFISAQLDPLLRQLNSGNTHCMNLLVVTRA